MELKSWEDDPALYMFTSLTAGSSHIITATSRIETILKAARIPFSYVDTATNESAKKLFQRRARGKKLPLLVKEGFVIADLEQVEEWNEFGELKEAIGEVASTATSVTTTPAQGMKTAAGTPLTSYIPSRPAALSQENKVSPAHNSTMAQLAQEAATTVKEKKDAQAPLNSISSATKTIAPEAPPPPSPSRAALSPTSPRHSIPASPKFIPQKSEPPQMTHRGSSLSLASDDEIRKVESDEMIVEDEEGEEEAEKGCGKVAGSKMAVEDKDDIGKDEDDLDDEEIDNILFGDEEEEEEEETSEPAPTKTETTETAESTETKEPVTIKSEPDEPEDLADKVSKVKIQD